jgi:hypothetical protein
VAGGSSVGFSDEDYEDEDFGLDEEDELTELDVDDSGHVCTKNKKRNSRFDEYEPDVFEENPEDGGELEDEE